MTHTELIKSLAKQLDLTPQEVAILWQQTSQIMMKELAQHEKIRIKNFGAFVTVKHKSRTVPDPREKSKKLVIFDQFLPKFRPSEELRRRVKDIIPQQFEVNASSDLETSDEEPLTTNKAKPVNEPEPALPKKKKAEESNTALDDFDITLPKGVDIGFADLTGLTIDPAILELVPYHIAQKYQLVPIEQVDDKLVVAMIDPGDREAIEILNRQTGMEVTPEITTQDDLRHALDQYNASNTFDDLTDDMADISNEEEGQDDEAGHSSVDDAPAAKIVNNLLERAVREKASDIHIEPDEKKIIVRFRVDGLLQPFLELPKTVQASVTARLKILANLKIDESRLPQDGRIRLVIAKKEVDFRVSTFPTVTGEKFVMRILDKSSGILTFEELGITGANLEGISDNIQKAHGMILVTGPTGSGKTTTLYSVIGKLMSPEVNIVTLEDPVEYRILGINQSQVNPTIGYDFASGLRTIVRQDPDVILIGEIRDLETATMAIHSALTGHVVLSTLHTNDAAGAIPRLIDMGIEPFLITSSTNAIVAQRLVRRICSHCKEKVKLPDEALTEVYKELEQLDTTKHPTFYKGKGCAKCNKSGYSGRMGIYETLVVSEAIKQLALKRVSASELTEAAIKEGMITLKQDGLLKALAGETTLEEVWRVTKD